MLDLPWLAGLATPSPTSTVRADDVTPGIAGFIAIAVVAIVIVLLAIDMLRRIRRAQYRIDVREELDAEEAAARAAEEPASPGGDAPRGDGDVSPGDPAKG